MYKISVIIPCVNGLPEIDACLTALRREKGNADVEFIVVNCCRNGTAYHIRRKFPEVRLLDVPKRLSIPELRWIGTEAAEGDIIAVIEDHCNVQRKWFEEILKAHGRGYKVVGGSVVNGCVRRTVDWAVFFCEYSQLMPPLLEGEVEDIGGNNVSYRRETLLGVNEAIRRNYWEYFLHKELKESRVKFFCVPSMVVAHKKNFSAHYFLTQRFHYSRSFAGMRAERASPLQRLFFLLLSPFLPILMMWRISRQVIRKRQYVKEFIKAVPLLLVFMISYALGEFVGYVCGPGRSILKVE